MDIKAWLKRVFPGRVISEDPMIGIKKWARYLIYAGLLTGISLLLQLFPSIEGEYAWIWVLVGVPFLTAIKKEFEKHKPEKPDSPLIDSLEDVVEAGVTEVVEDLLGTTD